jgi:hypothetical protein
VEHGADDGAFVSADVGCPGQSLASMARDATRIRKELAECAKDTKSGVTCEPVGDSLNKLQGVVKVMQCPCSLGVLSTLEDLLSSH